MPENKRKRNDKDIDGTQMPSPENPNSPMPFTCICYEASFYTTDENGYFIHKTNEGIKLIRCEETPERNVIFTFIRSLSETEIALFDHIDDVNVHRDLTNEV